MKCYVCGGNEFKDIMPYYAAPHDEPFKNCRVIKCTSCGLNQINKEFTAEQITHFYKNNYQRAAMYNFAASEFPKDNLFSVSRGRALAKLFKEKTGNVPKDVLDLGCGYGQLLFGFQQHFPNARYTGVEFDEGTKINLDKINAHFHFGGVEDIEGLNGSFDLIITSHVYEHVIDPHDFLERCKALLKPGGYLLFEMPNMNEFNLRADHNHSPHICLWEIETLKHIFLQHNLEIVFLKTAGKKHAWYEAMEDGFVKKLLRKLSRPFRESPVEVDVNDKESIGFELDRIGENRRNLRIIARLK